MVPWRALQLSRAKKAGFLKAARNEAPRSAVSGDRRVAQRRLTAHKKAKAQAEASRQPARAPLFGRRSLRAIRARAAEDLERENVPPPPVRPGFDREAEKVGGFDTERAVRRESRPAPLLIPICVRPPSHAPSFLSQERFCRNLWIKPKSRAEEDALLANARTTTYAQAQQERAARRRAAEEEEVINAAVAGDDFAAREREADELVAQIEERERFLQVCTHGEGHGAAFATRREIPPHWRLSLTDGVPLSQDMPMGAHRARVEREISQRLAQLRRVDPVNGTAGLAPVQRR